MSAAPATRLLGVSLKMYLSAAATRRWLTDVAGVVSRRSSAVEVFVLPTFPLIESAVSILAGSGVAVGAQDVAVSAAGAQTGEVSAAVLAELGCRYVAIGHAERRAGFAPAGGSPCGEDDAMVAAKAAQAVEHGLMPIVCVGEPDRVDAPEAVAHCRAQLDPVLAACGGAPVVVAYEPVWAIGADRPAPTAHVRAVAAGLRAVLDASSGEHRIVYGGSAGPGLFAELAGSVDGLFLGRFAHDPAAFATVLDELTALDEVKAPDPQKETSP